jgi:hypothetical protein
MVKILPLVLSLLSGAVIGWCLPALDKIAYIYILHPEAQISQYFRFQLKNKQWRKAYELLRLRGSELDKLTTRGLLFQLGWLGVALFALTSTAALFGKVTVLVLGLRILLEEWREWRQDKDLLKRHLLWQVKTDWPEKYLQRYLCGKTIILAWLCWLLVR